MTNHVYCSVLVVSAMFIIIIVQLWQDVLYIILSVNQSRLNRLLITEYVFEEEKYFYLLSLYVITATCIGLIATLATGSLLMAYLTHICGMFKIAR